MSGNAPVDPAEIPVFTGDLATLDEKVKLISSGGATVSTKASDVHTSFGGLQAFYQAPEADQLFATTKPVSDLGLKLSSDMCTIASALGTYSRDAAPIVKKLENLKAEAQAFRTKTDKDEKWREDGDLIDENLERRNKIAEVWAEFQEVERAAHGKIVALVGGKPLKVNDGSNGKDMYGYDAESMKQSKSLPWGDAVEESIPAWQVWEHAWEFGKGIVVDGVWGTLKGLGGLVGLQGWDVFKQSWTGLAKLGTGLAIMSIPGVGPLFLAAPDDKLPSWLRDSRTAMKETGKALLAWDQWGSNPSRAAGAVTFNVLTTVFTGGAGGAVSGAGKAGAVAKTLSFAGKAGRAIDPMTYMFKGAGAGFAKIGDVMAGLKGTGRFEVPSINVDGAVALPDGAVLLPDGAIHLPSGATVPEGATKLPDGTIKLPEGTTTLPPGTVKLPTPDGPRFMDLDGNIYKADGSLEQSGKAAKQEPSPDADANTPRVDAPKPDAPVTARVPERELAGVGARGGDDVVRLGSDTSPPPGALDDGTHAPGGFDNTPTGRAGDHTNPGGHAPDNMPSNSADTPTGGHTHTADSTVDNSGHGAHTDPTPTGGSGHTTDTTPTGSDQTPIGGGSGAGGMDGQPPAGGHGPDPWPSEEPRPFERGGETEQQIRENMRGSKVKPGDLDKALANLADHPAGQEMADLIASGQFKGMTNFDQVVSSFSQKNAMSGGVEQLRLADRLQKSGVSDISFEIKKDTEIKPGVTTGPKTDMDVMARDANGNVYGYQFKEVANPKKVTSKMWQNIGQLADSGADVKVFVVDTKGSVADMLAAGMEKDLARIHSEQGVIVVLRVEDGTLMYPPGASFMPGGRS
ncbi:hypothetical protein [Streptomyces sp. H27-S2]|uniref:hypothetical protein n=1 Tax=Streptomyces antarcticus TaxID=2996458 RepID=UPI00226E6A76|nr:hypothetical protein [Streptomyces sp. H27-S2]MCY0952742.1 hypothetical protein [Streptomyces sp. H27-S2]